MLEAPKAGYPLSQWLRGSCDGCLPALGQGDRPSGLALPAPWHLSGAPCVVGMLYFLELVAHATGLSKLPVAVAHGERGRALAGKGERVEVSRGKAKLGQLAVLLFGALLICAGAALVLRLWRQRAMASRTWSASTSFEAAGQGGPFRLSSEASSCEAFGGEISQPLRKTKQKIYIYTLYTYIYICVALMYTHVCIIYIAN